MSESGLYEIKSPILVWFCQAQLHGGADTSNVWIIYGLLFLSWFVLPVGLIHEVWLQRKKIILDIQRRREINNG